MQIDYNWQIATLSNAVASLADSNMFAMLDTLIEYCTSCNGRLAFAGIGKSSHVAELAADTFASLGVPALALNGADIAHGSAGYITNCDSVLLISKSGASAELEPAICAIKGTAPGAIIGLLTMTPNSFLGQLVDVVQVLKAETELSGFSPTTSTVQFVAYLMAGSERHRVVNRDQFLKRHPGGAIGMALLA